MENSVTVNGMKEVNKKLAQITESLDSIAKSFQKIEKILNRQFPSSMRVILPRESHDPGDIYTPDVIPFPDEEDDDE